MAELSGARILRVASPGASGSKTDLTELENAAQ